MKRILLLLTFTFSFFIGFGQSYRYVDPGFALWLSSNGYPMCLTGDSLDVSSSLVTNAHTLNITSDGDTLIGVEYFTSLDTIYCRSHIRNLPHLPATLKYADFTSNALKRLNSLPNGLRALFCARNQIDSIFTLPDSLRTFDCSQNYGPYLAYLPSYLEYFDCSNSYFNGVPSFPSSLTYINCNGANFDSLPPLPPPLYFLDCSFSPITSMPYIHNRLKFLYANETLISHFTNWGDSLYYVEIGNDTMLRSFPEITSNLTTLICPNCHLDSIPHLPNTLEELTCYNNNISVIKNLPNSLISIDCFNNPLNCLPWLPPNLLSLNYFNTNITCFPNIVPSCNYYPPMYFGLCNSDPDSCTCPFQIGVSGHIYADLDSDCIRSTGETGISHLMLTFTDSSGYTERESSDEHGDFRFDTVSPGIYYISIDTLNSPFEFSCRSITDSLYFPTSSTVFYHQDFAVRCKSGFDLSAINIVFNRVSYTRLLEAYVIAGERSAYSHLSCSHISGKIEYMWTGPATYYGTALGAVAPDSILPNRLVWNVADFYTFPVERAVNPVFLLDSSTVYGADICATVNISPTAGDRNPADNSYHNCTYIDPEDFVFDYILHSHDPNYKEVYPFANVDSNDWVNYTIHFQNNGTGPAYYVSIIDSLSSKLDIGTVAITGSSHDAIVQQISGHALRFTFIDIYLPDSADNVEGSKGFVSFKIKSLSKVTAGNTIKNFGDIYFDNNPPIRTDTAEIFACSPYPAYQPLYICPGGHVDVGTHTYCSAGMYRDSFVSSGGCDSFLVSNVQILSSNSNDSLHICSGDQVHVASHVYNSAGFYIDTTSNFLGCDSIIHTFISVQTIDTSVSSSSGTLHATLIGAAYQWLNCDAGSTAISGATAQSFSPTHSGHYAVVIGVGACRDTSSCQYIIASGIGAVNNEQIEVQTLLSLSESSLWHIQHAPTEAVIKLYDISGKQVANFHASELPFNLNFLSKGAYSWTVTLHEQRLLSGKLVVME
jgi:uncharacterized repeat protein (TIGR01451 family)